MSESEEALHSAISLDFRGLVRKRFLGPDAASLFENEIKILSSLAERGCTCVPAIVESDPATHTLVTTSCGSPRAEMTEEQADALFSRFESEYGVIHPDHSPRYVTYSSSNEQYCFVNFEQAELIEPFAPTRHGSKVWKGRWTATSVQGEKHPINEDSLLTLAVTADEMRLLPLGGEEILGPAHLVFAISDGMGGRNAGDFASRLVLNFIQKDALELYEVIESGSGGKRALELLTATIHDGLMRLSRRDPLLNGCGATLTLAWITPTRLYWVHVGDSRLYLSEEEHVEQLSEDHCALWRKLKAGEISEYSYRTDVRRSRLSDAIGGGHHRIRPQTGAIEINSGARILLCSDGIMDGLWDRQIKERLAKRDPIEEIAAEMVERSNENNAADDTTLIVAEFEIV